MYAPCKYYFGDDEKATDEMEETFARAGKKYDSLAEQEYDILDECERLNDILTDGLELAVPVLDVPATKEIALTAQKALIHKHRAILGSLEEPRLQIIGRLKRYIRVWEEMKKEYKTFALCRFQGERGKLCEERREEDINEDMQIELAKAQGSLDSLLLQRTIHTMLKDQPDEVKRCLLVEHNPFSAHLLRTRSDRPVIDEKTNHHVQRPIRNNSSLPPELMTMVYSFCELETCVVLRQVSADWYTAFHQSERVLSKKLLGRSPWMARDEELVSWALCVLVFVGRLRRPDRWAIAEDVIGLYHRRRVSPLQVLVPPQLEHGDKLPGSFKPLNVDIQVELENGGSLDPFTLKITRDSKDEKHKVIKSDDKELVIEYQGIKITLPPNTVLDNTPKLPQHQQPIISIHKYFIVVRCKEDHFLLSRARPHYRYGLDFPPPGDYTSMEVGEVFVLMLLGKYGVSLPLFYTDWGFKFYNPRGANLPVASYNGLIWFTNKTNIIPTFVDLNRPDVIYYRKDRIVSLPLEEAISEEAKEISQSSSSGYRRLLYKKSKKGMMVIDLAKTVITEIVAPGGDSDTVIPGFVNNKFAARYISDETRERYEGGEGCEVSTG